jgi:type I restriction enzyme S subunit
MVVNPGYKKTEVGLIPNDWIVYELGKIIYYTKGFAFKSSDYKSDGVRIIRVSDTTFSSITDENPVYLDLEESGTYSKWKLCENDLIVSTVGSKPPMWDSLVGKTILVEKKYEGSLLNQNTVRLRAKENKRYKQYLLFNNLRTVRYIKHIESIFRGNANQASITLHELFKFPLALPNNEKEQIAIAEALSDADALIEALERLIDKKRQIKQGAMQELLTGRKRLPGFSEEWKVNQLEKLAEIYSGGTPSTLQSHYWEGDILWCTPTDITALNGYKYLTRTNRTITNLGLKNSSAEMIPANSIVMTSRATIGECAINQVPVTTNQGFKNFVPYENVDVEFLYYLLKLKKQQLISLSSGSTFLEVGKTQLSKFEVHLPATKTEQEEIAVILSSMDEEIFALEEKLVKVRLIKRGMMQELLTGRIRLL